MTTHTNVGAKPTQNGAPGQAQQNNIRAYLNVAKRPQSDIPRNTDTGPRLPNGIHQIVMYAWTGLLYDDFREVWVLDHTKDNESLNMCGFVGRWAVMGRAIKQACPQFEYTPTDIQVCKDLADCKITGYNMKVAKVYDKRPYKKGLWLIDGTDPVYSLDRYKGRKKVVPLFMCDPQVADTKFDNESIKALDTEENLVNWLKANRPKLQALVRKFYGPVEPDEQPGDEDIDPDCTIAYYCAKCDSNHRHSSKIGQAHREFGLD